MLEAALHDLLGSGGVQGFGTSPLNLDSLVVSYVGYPAAWDVDLEGLSTGNLPRIGGFKLTSIVFAFGRMLGNRLKGITDRIPQVGSGQGWGLLGCLKRFILEGFSITTTSIVPYS